MIRREKLLEVAAKIKPACSLCADTGVVHSWDGKQWCPTCHPPAKPRTSDHDYLPQYGPGCGVCGVVFEDHETKTVRYDPTFNCPRCAASVCPSEEYHTCRFED